MASGKGEHEMKVAENRHNNGNIRCFVITSPRVQFH